MRTATFIHRSVDSVDVRPNPAAELGTKPLSSAVGVPQGEVLP